MSETKAARPSQVTMSGWVAVIGSALLVLTLFDSMSQLRSIEMRENVEDFLASPPGDGLGLTVGGALEVIRGLMLFTGAAAAVAMVLGIYVLQRNKGARIGFSVAAGALMLTAPVSGGFLPVLIAFAAMMLWTGPARAWFAGVTGAAGAGTGTSSGETENSHASKENVFWSSQGPPSSGEGSSDQGGGTQPWPSTPSAPAQDPPAGPPSPPPTQGFGAPAPQAPQQPSDPQGQQQAPYGQGQQQVRYGQGQQQVPYGQGQQQAPYGQGQQQGQPGQAWPSAYPQQQYAQQQYGQQPYGGYPTPSPTDSGKRPVTVTLAVWLTWIFCGLTLAVYGIVVIALLAAKDRLLEALRQEPEFQQLDIATDDLIAGLWVMSAVVIFWCIAAIVLAVLAFRRSNWARIVLVVSAATATMFSLAAFPFGLLHTLAAGTAVVLLFVGGANRWYSRKEGFASYPPGYPQQGAGPYPQQGAGPNAGQPPAQPPREEEQEPPKNVW